MPKVFRPCGETCFTLAIEVTAEKRSSKNRLKKLFSQFCAPVGTANLFVDKTARAFVLKDVKIETHCKGIVGWVINFLTPFLTKSYSEMKLFQMPPNLPLTIDTVRGGAHLVEIGGTVDWSAGEAKPRGPPEPQPVVVEPGGCGRPSSRPSPAGERESSGDDLPFEITLSPQRGERGG